MVLSAVRLFADDSDRNADPSSWLIAENILRQKLLCGIWLTACTYPIVVLVLPTIFFGQPRWQYLAVAETFAPVGECVIFWLAFRGKGLLETSGWFRCLAAIVVANLASFGFGEVLNYYRWFGLF